MASRARAAGPKSSASAMPATRPIIVRDARPADACSRTALFLACYTRTGRARSTNSRPSGSDEVSFSKNFSLDVDPAPSRATIGRRSKFNRMEAETMQYMLLIYETEGRKLSPAEYGQLHQEYMTFTQDIVKSGKFKAGDPLEPTSTATTVRVRNGKTVTTDGPFAETKEQLGGYYIVEAKDLEEAVAIAARRPGARTGRIEVCPVMKIPG